LGEEQYRKDYLKRKYAGYINHQNQPEQENGIVESGGVFDFISFYNAAIIVKSEKEILKAFSTGIIKLKSNFESALTNGSNWLFIKADKIDIHIGFYDPLKGARYIELPAEISNRKATINI